MRRLWLNMSFRNKILICLLLVIFLLSSICLILSQYINNVSYLSNDLMYRQGPEFLWIHHWQKEISTKRTLLEISYKHKSFDILQDYYKIKQMEDYSQLYGEIPPSLQELQADIAQTDFLYKNEVANLIRYNDMETAEKIIVEKLLPSLNRIEQKLQSNYQQTYDSLKVQSQSMSNTVEKALWTLFFGSIAAILLSVYLSYRVSKDLTKPIEDVIHKVAEISEGRYGLQLASPDQIELRKLATSINQMSSSLFESFDTLYKEKLFREKVMASIPIGIVTVNEEKNEIQINDKAKEIVDMKEDTWQEILYKDKVCKRNAEFWSWFQSKEFFQTRKVTIENKFNTYKVIVSQSPLLDQNKTVIGRIFYFIDISEIDALEQRIHRSEKLALVGEIAAGSAHEIRNPLAVIRGFIQIIHASVSEEQRRQFQLSLVLNELDRINKIVADMLLLAKPGAPKISCGSFEKEVLESIMPLILASCPEQINIHVDFDPVEICVDPEQMKQVFYNLIRNSIEAIEGVGEIYIYNELDKNYVHIYVKDTGKGIPPELKNDIFQPFTSTKETGTGLGLTIIQRIVENHNGEIDLVESNELGTTFKMTLPL